MRAASAPATELRIEREQRPDELPTYGFAVRARSCDRRGVRGVRAAECCGDQTAVIMVGYGAWRGRNLRADSGCANRNLAASLAPRWSGQVAGTFTYANADTTIADTTTADTDADTATADTDANPDAAANTESDADGATNTEATTNAVAAAHPQAEAAAQAAEVPRAIPASHALADHHYDAYCSAAAGRGVQL